MVTTAAGVACTRRTAESGKGPTGGVRCGKPAAARGSRVTTAPAAAAVVDVRRVAAPGTGSR